MILGRAKWLISRRTRYVVDLSLSRVRETSGHRGKRGAGAVGGFSGLGEVCAGLGDEQRLVTGKRARSAVAREGAA